MHGEGQATMASKRDRIKMTHDEMVAFIDEQRTLQVASIDHDGAPHLVAMWFTTWDNKLAFWTYEKSQKVVNLRRDPRITVMLESGQKYEELRGVMIKGHATIVEDRDEVLRFGEEVYERYWGPIEHDAVREGVRVMGAKRVVIVVEPDKVTSWDHSKLGGTY
jgi:PPOX class probable F420-dependent enzyme